MRRAALLIQLGSPDSPATGDVRRYLAQFLSDPRVLDIPWLPRMALLYGAILPFRPKKSGEAYQKIWTADGSPLVNLTRRQVVGVAERRPDLDVYGAMRYGRPSIDEAVAAIAKSGADEVVVVPLYPQYASASSGSSLEAVYRAFGRLPFVPAIRVVPPFYADPQWINVWAERTREVLAEGPADHVLFSFHGLPERQIARCDPTGAHCFQKADCCDVAVAANHACYRHQCVVTAKLIAASLSLPSWSVSFQSRLGNTPWIQPYTDVVVPELARSGKRRVVVACPSFTTDCLETLEEIGIRAQADFEAAGGESLRLVPCPNDHPRWLDALASLVGEVAHPSPVMGEGRALPPPSLRAPPTPTPPLGEGRAPTPPPPPGGGGGGGGQDPPRGGGPGWGAGTPMTVTREWLLGLQQQILTALEAQDTVAFRREAWTRDGDPLTGDGLTCVLEEGSFYERGAVNFSDIRGPKMPGAATVKRPELAGRPFRAMGVSLVLHPRNPRVPTVHMNVRSLGTMDGEVQWFGGGFDLTPYYPALEDVLHWHQTAKAACEPFGPEVYPALKAAADAYFYLPHRGETRGVGGLFAEDHDDGTLIRSIGDHFLAAWLPIAERRGGEPYGERERAFQLLRRGRYVEFNLVFDRGTHFGLHGGGRTESILVSMPPLASWRYDARFEAGSEEAGLGEWLRGRDWLG